MTTVVPRRNTKRNVWLATVMAALRTDRSFTSPRRWSVRKCRSAACFGGMFSRRAASRSLDMGLEGNRAGQSTDQPWCSRHAPAQPVSGTCPWAKKSPGSISMKRILGAHTKVAWLESSLTSRA